MKTNFTLLLLLSFLILNGIKTTAQTPIHTFTFDNTLANTANTVALTPSIAVNSASTLFYTTDRKGNANGALKNTNNHYLTATISNLPQGNAARSISMWVQFAPSGIVPTVHLACYGGSNTSEGYGLTHEVSLSRVINYGVNNDVTANQVHVENNSTWYNYVITYDGTTAKIFRNGVLLTSSAVTWNTVGNIFKIGGTIGGSNYFNAAIDDVKIYDVALTDAQAKDMYFSDFSTINNNLLAYYNFDNNTNSHNNLYNLTTFAGSAITYGTGKFGNAGTFSGSQALATTALSGVISNSEYTISFWVNRQAAITAYPTFYELFASNYVRTRSSDYDAEIGYAVSSSAYVSTTTTIAPSIMPLNAWLHFALVFKNTPTNKTQTLYLNGSQIMQTSGSLSNTIYPFNNVFCVGGGTIANGTVSSVKFFKGLIDEMYIYNRPLSQHEVDGLRYAAASTILLPTSLLNFNATFKNNDAKLNWTTTTEINTQNFEVEYSNNGREFSKVATITAAGNSNTTKQYSYTHAVSNNAVHYYRLKMNDKDGKYAYSNIVKLKSETKTFTAEVFPTIVKDNATISIQTTLSQTATISLIDNNGRIVKQMNAPVLQGSNSLQLETKNISNGFYTVQIKTGKEQIVQRIIKQ